MALLRRNADRRSYHLLGTTGELRALFALFGFAHSTLPGSHGPIHRWVHGTGRDKTILLLFPAHDDQLPRLSLMGPLVAEVDQIAIEQVA